MFLNRLVSSKRITGFVGLKMLLQPIHKPKDTLDVELNDEVMSSYFQVPFITAMSQGNITHSKYEDTSYSTETGKGQIYIPEYKDFYLGEPL